MSGPGLYRWLVEEWDFLRTVHVQVHPAGWALLFLLLAVMSIAIVMLPGRRR